MIFTAAGIAAGAGKVAKGIGKFLQAVPLWVWLAVAIAGTWWWDRGAQYDAGVAAAEAQCALDNATADAEAKAAQDTRDKEGHGIDKASDERAADAVLDTRTATAKAVETIRYEIRTIEVPAGCPTGLPDRVRDEGRAAVERARAAGAEVRKGRDP